MRIAALFSYKYLGSSLLLCWLYLGADYSHSWVADSSSQIYMLSYSHQGGKKKACLLQILNKSPGVPTYETFSVMFPHWANNFSKEIYKKYQILLLGVSVVLIPPKSKSCNKMKRDTIMLKWWPICPIQSDLVSDTYLVVNKFVSLYLISLAYPILSTLRRKKTFIRFHARFFKKKIFKGNKILYNLWVKNSVPWFINLVFSLCFDANAFQV